MSDFRPPDMTQRYRIDGIEFRDEMVIVNFTDDEALKGRFIQDHTVRVIQPGDEDVDRLLAQIYELISELLDTSYVSKRNPPDTIPASLRRG